MLVATILARSRALSFASPLLALVPIVALAAHARAQLVCGNPQVDGAPYNNTVWVDPINGNDFTALPNNPAFPTQTIGRAFQLIPTSGLNAANRGLIHLNPGIYSLATNVEVFPVRMRDFVDVQGVGAKQVVLRGAHDTPTMFNVFYPTDPGDCTCGSRSQKEILVDFTFLGDDTYDEMLDGVTLEGGDVQVYAETEGRDIDGRVSNCVFDMLDKDTIESFTVGGPDFGVLMVHVFDLHYDAGYHDVRMRLFNNTFIQSWDPVPAGMEEPLFGALPGSVAICDVNDPLCANPNGDMDRTLRGVGNPSIQNNLIRAFDPTPPTALLGIDLSDVSCAVGTRLGPTDAFDPASFGNQNANLTFCSKVVGTNPFPRTSVGGVVLNPNGRTGGVDPTFVGEAVSSQTGGAVPITHTRDWRLIPDSILRDEGSAPAISPSGNLELDAANGTLHFDLACTPSSSFDFDGEVYGNPRIVPSMTGPVGAFAQPDIGFDETNWLIDCTMVNDTIVHTAAIVPFFGNFIPGLGNHLLVYPSIAPQPGPDAHFFTGTLTAIPFGAAYTVFPGSQLPPLNATLIFGPIFGVPFDVLWINLFGGTNIPLAGPGPTTQIVFVSAYGAGVHVASFAIVPGLNAALGVAEQSLYTPSSGPNAGVNVLSNEQPVFD